jgi:hypothetical protein
MIDELSAGPTVIRSFEQRSYPEMRTDEMSGQAILGISENPAWEADGEGTFTHKDGIITGYDKEVVPLVEGTDTMIMLINKEYPEKITFIRSNVIKDTAVSFEGSRKTFDQDKIPDELKGQNPEDFHIVAVTFDMSLQGEIDGMNHNGLTIPENFHFWEKPGETIVQNPDFKITTGHDFGDYFVDTSGGLRFRLSTLFDKGVGLFQGDNRNINIITGQPIGRAAGNALKL